MTDKINRMMHTLTPGDSLDELRRELDRHGLLDELEAEWFGALLLETKRARKALAGWVNIKGNERAKAWGRGLRNEEAFLLGQVASLDWLITAMTKGGDFRSLPRQGTEGILPVDPRFSFANLQVSHTRDCGCDHWTEWGCSKATDVEHDCTCQCHQADESDFRPPSKEWGQDLMGLSSLLDTTREMVERENFIGKSGLMHNLFQSLVGIAQRLEREGLQTPDPNGSKPRDGLRMFEGYLNQCRMVASRWEWV